MHCGFHSGSDRCSSGSFGFYKVSDRWFSEYWILGQELDWLRIYRICYTKERCSVIPENRSAYHCLVIVSLQGGKITIPTVKDLLLTDLWSERFAMYNIV